MEKSRRHIAKPQGQIPPDFQPPEISSWEEEMIPLKPYDNLILFKVIPEGRRIGILPETGIIHVPEGVTCYFAHKGVPPVWHSEKHYHGLLKVTGKESVASRSVKVERFQ